MLLDRPWFSWLRALKVTLKGSAVGETADRNLVREAKDNDIKV